MGQDLDLRSKGYIAYIYVTLGIVADGTTQVFKEKYTLVFTL